MLILFRLSSLCLVHLAFFSLSFHVAPAAFTLSCLFLPHSSPLAVAFMGPMWKEPLEEGHGTTRPNVELPFTFSQFCRFPLSVIVLIYIPFESAIGQSDENQELGYRKWPST